MFICIEIIHFMEDFSQSPFKTVLSSHPYNPLGNCYEKFWLKYRLSKMCLELFTVSSSLLVPNSIDNLQFAEKNFLPF